jgi:hypothetical protein
MRADHPALGTMQLACDTFDRTLFCENETNTQRCFGVPNPAGLHPKDTFNDFVVHGTLASLPAMQEGTKGAFMLARTVAAGASVTMRARLRPAKATGDAFADFDKLFHLILCSATSRRVTGLGLFAASLSSLPASLSLAR